MQHTWQFPLAHTSFVPHGHCYLWQPGLMGLHITSDALIATAYYSIPLTLIYFVRRRQDLPFDWMFQLFSSFIIACGTTHIIGIWTLWHPTYWVSGLVKALTAGVSVYTAVALIPLVPRALSLPSPAQLEAANRELEREIADRKQIEESLRQSEARYRTAVEEQQESQRFIEKITRTAPVLLYVYDLIKQCNVYINREVTEILGYTAEEVQAMGDQVLQQVMHPDDLMQLPEHHAYWQTAQDNDIFSLEYRVKHRNGEWRYFQCQETLFARTCDDAPWQILGTAIDISDRKITQQLQTALKEKEILLQEIHHRVKNNLQIVYSLLRLQQRRVQDPKAAEILLDSQNRIKSIALIHEKLYRSESLSEIVLNQYIPNIAIGLFSTYRIDSNLITLQTEIADIPLNIDTAISCGLIVNELVSNSLKYAFPDSQTGRIAIAIGLLNDSMVQVTFNDDGIGLPDHLNLVETTSLGLKLVKDLVGQLEGTLEIKNEQGAAFRITFPWRRS